MYELLLSSRAQRDVRGFPTSVSRRVIRAMKGLTEDPRPVGCRKIVGSENDWRIRVGDYRIVYEMDDKAREVHVMYVRHRREAYR